MTKILAKIIYKIIWGFDYIFKKITKRSFLIWFKDFIEETSYKTIKINGKDITFFTPNYISSWLISEFYSKEPETIEWIDNFDANEKCIFWDIGSNIGIFSIYAALKHKNAQVISFEPSTSNLRILTRNISINNLENKIKVNQFPLSNVENKHLIFYESKFMEGLGVHSFGEPKNFEGLKFNPENKYSIFGTNINYLIKNEILEIPNYIKIDVDGIEHLILEGAQNYLKDQKIKSVAIELNENYKQQFEKVLKIMDINNFKISGKKRAENLDAYKDKKLEKVYNYFFEKK